MSFLNTFGNKGLLRLYEEFFDYYFQDKHSAVLDTLIKINEQFSVLISEKKYIAEYNELYSFAIEVVGDYYTIALDSHKGLRFFKEKIYQLKKVNFNNHDIYLSLYTKIGELYIDTNNISKASECASLCQIITIEKKQRYESVEILEALIKIKSGDYRNGILQLIQILNNSADTDLFDYYHKNKITNYLLKYVLPEHRTEFIFGLLQNQITDLLNFSDLFIAENKFHKAIICIKSALQYAVELIKNKILVSKYPEILVALAKIYYNFGFHNKASALFEQGMYYADSENINGPLLFELYIGAIRSAAIMKNYSMALQLIEKAENFGDINKFPEYEIKLWFEKALCKSKYGNDDDALAIFKNIEKKIEENNIHELFKLRYQIKINNERCFILLKNFETKNALELYKTSFKLIKQYSYTPEYAETLRGIATSLSVKEINSDSLKFFQESLIIYSERYNINKMIVAMTSISKYYIRSGDISEAMFYIDESIRLLEMRENTQELPILYSQKAKIYLLQNNYQKAEEFFKKDLNITKQTENIHSLAFSYYHLGLVYQKQNILSIAESNFKKSLEYFNIIDNPNNKILALLQLAVNNAKCGVPRYVTKYIQDAENCWNRSKNRLLQAHLYLIKGICYSAMNKRGQQIEGLYRSSIKIYENIDPLNIDLIDAYYEFSVYYEYNSNLKDSISYLKSAIELSKKIGLNEKVDFLLKRLNEISELESQKLKLLSMTGAESDYIDEKSDSLKVIERYMTIFFIDIRGFTRISETLNISKLEAFLNDFYINVTKIITMNNGIINKFIGDSVLAFFNITGADDKAEEKAIKSAKDILTRLDSINQRRLNLGDPIIETGIGINSGKVLLGAFGSVQRTDYTAIGDVVNIASRLQSLAKKGEILVGETVYEKIKNRFDIEFHSETEVKGKSNKIKIFKIV